MAAFYATRLGRMTADLLRRKLQALWPNAAGQSLLGLGHTGPYLPLWHATARCVSVSPRAMGCAPWPLGHSQLACLAEEDALPFPDLSFDRILLVHGLEQAESARRALREVWRVLKDDGQLIVVAPNRRGIWAYAESTPFGHGEPYSPGQLTRLLEGAFFHVHARHTAVFAPPLDWYPSLRLFGLFEMAGQALAPRFAGLSIAEASKDLHGLVPASPRTSRRKVLLDAGG